MAKIKERLEVALDTAKKVDADAHMQPYVLHQRYQSLLERIAGDQKKIVPHTGLSSVRVAAVDRQGQIVSGEMVRAFVIEMRPQSWSQMPADDTNYRVHYLNLVDLLEKKVAEINGGNKNDLSEALLKAGYGKIIIRVSHFVYVSRRRQAKREDATYAAVL